MHGRTAKTASAVNAQPNRVTALLHNVRRCPLKPPRPDLRAIQIGKFARRPGFQDQHLLTGLGQYGCIDAACRAGAGDDYIDFVRDRHDYQGSGGMMCGM